MASPLATEEEARPPKQLGGLDAELSEKIRLAAKSIVLDIPISPKDGPESWLSPITCEGAALATDLCTVIRANSKGIAFRSGIKLIIIQEEIISKLLTNLKSLDRSLRLTSVYLLSFIVVPSQYELTLLFINSGGLKTLESTLNAEDNEGLAATAMQLAVSVFMTGVEFHQQVYDLLPTVIKRLRHMRTAGFILTILENITELIRLRPDQSSHMAIITCGLGELLKELKRKIAAGEVQAESIPQLATMQKTMEGLLQWTNTDNDK